MTSRTRRALRNTAISVGGKPRTVFGAFSNRSSTHQQLRQMGSVGTLFAIVNRTSNATAQVDWHLYRKSTDKRRKYGTSPDGPREEVFSHLALDVWNKPNPFYTRQEFVETFQQHIDLTGEGWWVVSKSVFGWPETMWCVRPDKMEPVPHPTDFLSGYIYKGPDDEKVPLGLDEVVQLRMPNPLDPYRGMGPVQSLLTDLDATKYSAEWNRNFFLNNAQPGGMLKVDHELPDEEYNTIQLRWAEQHMGVANAHRVGILENGAEWVDANYSMKDMQFAQLRDVSREIIREAFGFHNGLLGGSEVGHSRAELEAVLVYFARFLIKARLERIKGALNNDFLPMFGPTAEGVEFDYDDPSPEDREADNAELTTKVNAAVALIGAGGDPASVLEVVGLPEMVFKGVAETQGATA